MRLATILPCAWVLVGCASMMPGSVISSDDDRPVCSKLVEAVRQSMVTGSAMIDAETAAFALRKRIQVNVTASADGKGYVFVPRDVPVPLLMAAGVNYDNVPAETVRRRATLATTRWPRCEWVADSLGRRRSVLTRDSVSVAPASSAPAGERLASKDRDVPTGGRSGDLD